MWLTTWVRFFGQLHDEWSQDAALAVVVSFRDAEPAIWLRSHPREPGIFELHKYSMFSFYMNEWTQIYINKYLNEQLLRYAVF